MTAWRSQNQDHKLTRAAPTFNNTCFQKSTPKTDQRHGRKFRPASFIEPSCQPDSTSNHLTMSSKHLSKHLSIHPSYPSIHPSILPSYLSIHHIHHSILSINLTHPSIHLTHPSIHPSVHPSIHASRHACKHLFASYMAYMLHRFSYVSFPRRRSRAGGGRVKYFCL